MSSELNDSGYGEAGPPPDVITLRDLRVAGVVGVLPEERTRAQPLSIDLEIETDLTRAGMSDQLNDSVDYGAVCDSVVAIVVDNAPFLLERLAHLITDDLFAEFDLIDSLTVEVRKLRPPVPHDLGTSGVRITRRRRR